MVSYKRFIESEMPTGIEYRIVYWEDGSVCLIDKDENIINISEDEFIEDFVDV